MTGVGSVQETLLLEGEMPLCGNELFHNCFYLYSVLEAPETKIRSYVSSKVAYSIYKGSSATSLCLQYVPQAEDLIERAKICVLAHGFFFPQGISTGLLQLCYTWPTTLLQFPG